ncbi:M14 family zinc carboxypeptidase [Leifsonia sp. NPDC058194]|uniref:M14 family zinc carboxypeptidase n=1 Tax=Leifsonia sp. NPDC058194 TaxID=3346374 RepID=UPI0036D9414C
MSLTRLFTGAGVVALVATSLVTGGTPAATAAATAVRLDAAPIVTPVSSLVQPPASYPTQPLLRTVADDPTDASIARGVTPYDEIAPKLNTLMAQSDRVSAQVVGSSTLGRDIHLVTVTAPESTAATAQQAAWRAKIKDEPTAAAVDPALMAGYKVPIWFNANIHGNEWEGTDAVLDYITKLATDPAATDVLSRYRFYFTVTNNPDGRIAGQRANGAGFDANRDMVTGVTPEARVIRDLAGVIQPTFYIDLHGYTNVLQIEPCGPPHGENYEYDLFLPHAYAAARAIEDAVVSANIPGNTYLAANGSATTTNTGKIKIPYRDVRSGWDDWPPLFTPQFLAYQGAVTNTVELPLGRTANQTTNQANAKVNIEVAGVVLDSAVDYVADNSAALLANQIEIFRRGATGEPLKTIPADVDPANVPAPNEWATIWDETDVYTAEFPRAYVIPVDGAQRSTTDAARLVDQLIANGVEVQRAVEPFTAGGTAYAAGSYVIDMHQPLRGMANVLLADGSDISTRVPDMYDISAWSLALLWGADVDRIGATTDAAVTARTEAVTKAAATGSLPAAGSYLELATTGVAEYQAVNALLAAGIPVSSFADGSVILGRDVTTRAAAQEVANGYGVAFSASDGSRLRSEPSTGLTALRVAYTGTQDDRVTLERLGFRDIVNVTAASLTSGAVTLDDVDVLWIGSALSFSGTQTAGRDAVTAYLAAGKGVAGKGTAIAAFSTTFGITTATATSGTSGSNGIVRVANAEGGLLTGHTADTAFIYPAVWYTGLGENAAVQQRYATDGTFVSGHWADAAGRSRADAAGQASAVSATGPTGSRLVMLGTSVNFRTHPVGSYPSIARALLWAAPTADGVTAPVAEEDLTEEVRGSVRVPDTVTVGETFRVEVGDADGTTVRAVLFSTPVELATAVVADGGFSVTLPAGTAPGVHRLAVVTDAGALLGWDDLTAVAAVVPGGDGGTGGGTDGGTSTPGGTTVSGDLASTGSSVTLPLALGGLALLAGAVALIVARTRRDRQEVDAS